MTLGKNTRGYFGVGMEGISKEANFGTIARTAHAFGASFIFGIKPDINVSDMRSSDTAASPDHVPYYEYDKTADMQLPKGCQVVGVELVEGAVPLPVGVAAAIVMYDRQICLGMHAPRPVKAGGPPDMYIDTEAMKAVKHPIRRKVRTKSASS